MHGRQPHNCGPRAKRGRAVPASPSAGGTQWVLQPARVLLTCVLHCPVALHLQTHTKAAAKLSRILRWGTPAWRASESGRGRPSVHSHSRLRAQAAACGRPRVEPPHRDGHDGTPVTGRFAAILPRAQTTLVSDSNGRAESGQGAWPRFPAAGLRSPVHTGDWLLPLPLASHCMPGLEEMPSRAPESGSARHAIPGDSYTKH